MASLHGITLKMATVVTAQDSGSLRGDLAGGAMGTGGRKEESGKEKTPLCGKPWGMTAENAVGRCWHWCMYHS